MSVNKKNRSLWGTNSEAQKIYHQRQTIKRLEKEKQELNEKIEYLKNDIDCLKDEIEWYKQQCDDLKMEIGCSYES